MKRKWIDPSRLLFVMSSALLIFGYGVVVGQFNVFPYRILRAGALSLEEIATTWRSALGLRPDFFIEPAKYPGEGVTTNHAVGPQPGLTLMAGFFDRGNEVRLIRLDGTVVRRWPVRFTLIYPDAPHIQPSSDVPKSDWNIDLHSALAVPDGSILFNFEGAGLVKLDRCGRVVWNVPRRIHHSLEAAEGGGYWVGGMRYVQAPSPYAGIPTPFLDQTVIRVSENGDILEEFSVLQVLLDNSPGWFFGNATFGIPNADFFHLNDVEELTSTMAKSFPQFETGDLLLSLRGLSMLMIVDPHTRRIKWTQVGRWLRQHDPDFQTTGLISLFNNNTFDGAPHLNATAFSSILELDPRTGATTVRYSGAPGKPMYTEFRGHHQYLDNGNVLITESNSGRVLEVDREGTVVWEFINRYDDRQAAVIYQARRYPEHHFAVQDWSCPN